MATICFASVKGGVGKTSLSINIAHAFAKRGCRTLLIDCDPTAHTTRYLSPKVRAGSALTSQLAQIFLNSEINSKLSSGDSYLDFLLPQGQIETHQGYMLEEVRENLCLISASDELRHFLWGKGAQIFREHFPLLINELESFFDVVVIDTPPEYNVLTRNAIAVSQLSLVPVDSSEMSINSLEELLNSAAHIENTKWGVVRTMVNRAASRVKKLRDDSLNNRFNFQSREEDDSRIDSQEFIQMLEEREEERKAMGEDSALYGNSPIYLLETAISRTELHNKMSFYGKTAFDAAESRALSRRYLTMASEIEELLSIIAEANDEKQLESEVNLVAQYRCAS